MHGTGDLYVPLLVEQGLKRAVTAAGKQQLLTQRLYRIAGHCGFNAAEQERAFDDLVKWVRDGVKPEGDEVAGDLSDAGRTFTNPLRPGDPGGLRITPPTEAGKQAQAAHDTQFRNRGVPKRNTSSAGGRVELRVSR
jgi:hypothetical protein